MKRFSGKSGQRRSLVQSHVWRSAFVSAPPPISHMFMSGCSISEIEEGRRPAPLSRKLVTSADSVAVDLSLVAVRCTSSLWPPSCPLVLVFLAWVFRFDYGRGAVDNVYAEIYSSM